MLEQLWQLEINIILFFQNLGEWLRYPFQAFTFLGNEEFYIIFMPALYWCLDSLMGVRTGIMLVLSGSINCYIKFLFHSPRPYWFDTRVKPYISEPSFGVPSGHAQNAASIWGTVAVNVKKKWFTITTLVIVFFIGLSRIYLGVHFTRDVLSGWLIGAILLWIYYLVEKPIIKWIAPKRLPIQILWIFVFSIVLILLAVLSKNANSNWVMPNEWIETALLNGGEEPDPFNLEGTITLAGVAFGFLSGFACWYKKYGVKKIKGSLVKRFVRYFVGIIGVLIFYMGLKLVFPEDPLWLGFILRYIRYGLIGFWVSYLAPLLFIKLKLDK